jgi:uncharacterized protein (TIGR03083 family)
MEPIFTASLFPKLDAQLLTLLRSLTPEDWQKRTVVPLWTVHDVALHLLDGNIRGVSMLRDGYFGVSPGDIHSYADLVAFLNKLNADWLTAMKRLSPVMLIDLLEHSGQQFNALMASLDPFETALFPVAWAGESSSLNWFHIARDYTEKYHHQQQIRLAVGQDAALYTREFYLPYLETSMRALPHHYRMVDAAENEVIQFRVDGVEGAVWFLQRSGGQWLLNTPVASPPVCQVNIPAPLAWRLFTKGIPRTEAEKQVSIAGRRDLGEKIFDMLAVMA